MGSGKKFKANDLAAKLMEDIKTKNERYVPWT
jgi:hypothetical protein